jgi:hypothetical protein
MMRYASRERMGRRNERFSDNERMATEARKLAAAMASSTMVGARLV